MARAYARAYSPHVVVLTSPGAGHVLPVAELAARLAAQHGVTATIITFTNLSSPEHSSALATLPAGVSVAKLLDDLEHDTLVAFQDLCDKGVYPPVYAVGPFIRSCSDEAAKHRCMEWLDGQPDGSVLYMCFGNGGALSSRQILAWPLFAEQWINVVKLSSEGAGVALRLRAREDAGDGMVPREEETAAARELMAGENGAVVRKKAHELRVGAEKAAAADGPARRALAAVMDTWNGGSAHAAS